MEKFFYDKQDKIIRNTKETYDFFIMYHKGEYESFDEYMGIVFPDHVWIENYREETK